MPMTKLKARLDVAIWVLIFGGLFAIAFGIATRSVAPATAWSLMVVGGCVVVAGIVLIWVRSRLGPDR